MTEEGTLLYLPGSLLQCGGSKLPHVDDYITSNAALEWFIKGSLLVANGDFIESNVSTFFTPAPEPVHVEPVPVAEEELSDDGIEFDGLSDDPFSDGSFEVIQEDDLSDEETEYDFEDAIDEDETPDRELSNEIREYALANNIVPFDLSDLAEEMKRLYDAKGSMVHPKHKKMIQQMVDKYEMVVQSAGLRLTTCYKQDCENDSKNEIKSVKRNNHIFYCLVSLTTSLLNSYHDLPNNPNSNKQDITFAVLKMLTMMEITKNQNNAILEGADESHLNMNDGDELKCKSEEMKSDNSRSHSLNSTLEPSKDDAPQHDSVWSLLTRCRIRKRNEKEDVSNPLVNAYDPDVACVISIEEIESIKKTVWIPKGTSSIEPYHINIDLHEAWDTVKRGGWGMVFASDEEYIKSLDDDYQRPELKLIVIDGTDSMEFMTYFNESDLKIADPAKAKKRGCFGMNTFLNANWCMVSHTIRIDHDENGNQLKNTIILAELPTHFMLSMVVCLWEYEVYKKIESILAEKRQLGILSHELKSQAIKNHDTLLNDVLESKQRDSETKFKNCSAMTLAAPFVLNATIQLERKSISCNGISVTSPKKSENVRRVTKQLELEMLPTGCDSLSDIELSDSGKSTFETDDRKVESQNLTIKDKTATEFPELPELFKSPETSDEVETDNDCSKRERRSTHFYPVVEVTTFSMNNSLEKHNLKSLNSKTLRVRRGTFSKVKDGDDIEFETLNPIRRTMIPRLHTMVSNEDAIRAFVDKQIAYDFKKKKMAQKEKITDSTPSQLSKSILISEHKRKRFDAHNVTSDSVPRDKSKTSDKITASTRSHVSGKIHGIAKDAQPAAITKALSKSFQKVFGKIGPFGKKKSSKQ